MRKRRLILGLLIIIGLLGPQGCLTSVNLVKGNLRGLVANTAGTPLSGVRVSTPQGSTLTDTNGEWKLEGFEPQYFSVTAEKDGYEAQTINVEVRSGETVENVNFTLLEKGALYSINVTSITSSGAVISFYTRDASTSHVEYGLNTLYEQKTSETATASTYHQFVISNLTPATTYHVSCVAVDQKGRILRSADKTFTTLFTRRGDPPTNVAVGKDSSSDSVVVTWSADTTGDFAGYKLYRSESENGSFVAVDTNMLTNPRYVDNNVVPGQKVYYRVTRVSGTTEESPPSNTVAFLLPGISRTNLVWTPDQGSYILTGDVLVSQGTSLTITRGTTVKVASQDQWDADASSDKKIELRIQGTLIIEGTTDLPVIITSNADSPKAGDWTGITFEPVSNLNTSRITGLKLAFAKNGIQGQTGVPAISNSRFTDCSASGVECTEARNPVELRNLTAETCVSGFLIASNTTQTVTVASCTALKCFYGIISRGNKTSELVDNKIQFWSVAGMDLNNIVNSSRAFRNVVAPGSNGTAIVIRGADEVRKNTLQGHIGIEILGSGKALIRSNLILANTQKSDIGVLYRGDATYAPASHTIQANDVWDLAVGSTLRYRDQNGASLTGIGSDQRLDPALQGGNPFVDSPSVYFNYTPSPESLLNGRGYGGEDIGAYDVP